MLPETGRLFLEPEVRRAETEPEAEPEAGPGEVLEADSEGDAESRPNSFDWGMGEINHRKNMKAIANTSTNSIVDVSMASGCANNRGRYIVSESGSPVINFQERVLQVVGR